MRYWYKPAEWWQFWMPQSGLPGGAIAGVILIIALMPLLWWMQ